MTKHIERIIKQALKEDIGRGDITTDFLLENNSRVQAQLIAKQNGILCGIEIFEKVFRTLSDKWTFSLLFHDGEVIKKGQLIAVIKGPVKMLLTGERTALNFLQRLSGIATMTREFVNKTTGSGIEILDTRKTTPNIRLLEKYAVRVGGGTNHRFGLYDMVLIKDNHITSFMRNKEISKEKAVYDTVTIAKEKAKGKYLIEVEVENASEAVKAYEAKADIIMFDNADAGEIKTFSLFLSGKKRKPLIEWSGNVNLKTIKAISRLQIDRISVGAVTHSAASIDFSLKIKDEKMLNKDCDPEINSG